MAQGGGTLRESNSDVTRVTTSSTEPIGDTVTYSVCFDSSLLIAAPNVLQTTYFLS